ncbi:hypothetical protein DPMN_178614 [Dreissena polymorpha]|uniref:Uncharacterized protein n=1 Tax=Dreissena polymorpha TaxID=45954 RepID=A0A9D4ED85_DREPO|nr:hypothetical protein DPMN_178614 [Dreissena polymorpha]
MKRMLYYVTEQVRNLVVANNERVKVGVNGLVSLTYFLSELFQCWNRILKAFANSLDPDETPQNVASHQDPNCLLF